MPVKIELEKPKQTFNAISADIDNLVKEVQERLCLKKKEKFGKFRTMPYSTKMSKSSRLTKWRNTGCKCPSPISRKYKAIQDTHSTKCCGRCLDENDPHILLQKLIDEQTLIQEAVKRLGLQTKSKHRQFPWACTLDSDYKGEGNLSQ
ncbi:uncharacterized protein LOC121389149 [Gigantopelta aegis]|uniref:uncharacterized protein LOC121389149 n=1 Tax=Gigantopelta aegis TaxID=1735272 RepID=UPI001B888356|nr:uncharacterized protein LOC121389149 [Gigantopelta aegis]